MFAFIRLAKGPSRLTVLVLVAAASLGVSGAAASPMLKVTLDQAKVTSLPEGTKTLVIGSPIVADVTLLKGSTTMVVTGKGFGETNLIALDAQGNVLDEKLIRVEPTSSAMVVQRGMNRESYSCTPQCMPVAELGDANDTFTDRSSQIKARNDLAQPANNGPAH
jgi:hypothetical protein